MQANGPHYLLYSAASSKRGARRWKFVLQSVGSDDSFSAADMEPDTRESRLELLAVVRGLEALDQPSRVTLVTRSRYVAQGIRRELSQWRERRWRWERFGKLVPIRDHDLWQRVDRALEFHQIECVPWQFDIEPESPALAATVYAAEAAVPEPAIPEPALMIVPRAAADRSAHKARNWRLSRSLHRLRDGILAPFSAILRPAFTRAA